MEWDCLMGTELFGVKKNAMNVVKATKLYPFRSGLNGEFYVNFTERRKVRVWGRDYFWGASFVGFLLMATLTGQGTPDSLTHWAGDQTPASSATWATVVQLLTHFAIVGMPGFLFCCFFFACTGGMWKFPGQGWNSHHSSNSSCWATGELQK